MQTATAGAGALIRLGTAAYVSGNLKNFRKRPTKPIELYEFEGCPFCRKVICLVNHSLMHGHVCVTFNVFKRLLV